MLEILSSNQVAANGPPERCRSLVRDAPREPIGSFPAGQTFRLEAAHLARRRRVPVNRLAVDNPERRRIMPQAFGVVQVPRRGRPVQLKMDFAISNPIVVTSVILTLLQLNCKSCLRRRARESCPHHWKKLFLGLLPLPQGLGSDLGQRREQVVDDAAGVGADFNRDGHAGGQRDGRVIDFHRGFVERHGHRKNETLGLTGGRGRLLSRVGGRGGVGERAFGVLLGDGR
jgi:hypothetical protein